MTAFLVSLRHCVGFHTRPPQKIGGPAKSLMAAVCRHPHGTGCGDYGLSCTLTPYANLSRLVLKQWEWFGLSVRSESYRLRESPLMPRRHSVPLPDFIVVGWGALCVSEAPRSKGDRAPQPRFLSVLFGFQVLQELGFSWLFGFIVGKSSCLSGLEAETSTFRFHLLCSHLFPSSRFSIWTPPLSWQCIQKSLEFKKKH